MRGGGAKVHINGLGHKTKMAPCPYMIKHFINLLQNQMSDVLETYNDPGLTVMYFTARSNLFFMLLNDENDLDHIELAIIRHNN